MPDLNQKKSYNVIRVYSQTYDIIKAEADKNRRDCIVQLDIIVKEWVKNHEKTDI